MTEKTNNEWVAALTATDKTQEAALEDLRKRLHRSIYYYLSQDRSDLRDLAPKEIQAMAGDMAQDAVLRIMDNLASFRGESRFTTWANKIAVRLAISTLRRARYKNFSLDDLTAEGDFLAAHTNLVTDAPPSPEESAERDDVMAKIMQAFRDALTERQYQALVSVALEGVPMDIVAEQMGTNRNALYKLIHDARRKLKAHLEAEGISTNYMMRLFEK